MAFEKWKGKLGRGKRVGDPRNTLETLMEGSLFRFSAGDVKSVGDWIKISAAVPSNVKTGTQGEKEEYAEKWPHVDHRQMGLTPEETKAFYEDTNQMDKLAEFKTSEEKGEWGAADLTAADFVDPATGEQLPLQQVVLNVQDKMQGAGDPKTTAQIEALVRDMAPKFTSVGKELEEDKAEAKAGLHEDIYGLQKGAQQAGQQMQQAYGGMGGGMRGAIGTQKEMARGMKTAERGYGAKVRELERGAATQYEGDIEKFIAEGFGRKGGYVFRDGSGISNNVKRKKTFLDILSEIPDGKGT